MDATQIKWYSILASFFIVLIESIIIVLIGQIAYEIDWNLLVFPYFDIYVPILLLVNIRTSKKLGDRIIYDQLPAFKVARHSITNTIIFSHLISINLFCLYLIMTDSTTEKGFESIGVIFLGFLVVNAISFIVICLVSIIPNQLSGYILAKIIKGFRS